MEDALTRLDRAIEYAVLATVSGGRDQRGKLYARIAHAMTTQGSVNAVEAMHLLPNFDALRAVLPIIVTGDDGGKALHPVWCERRFVAPAICALAVFFERNLDPRGDGMLSMEVFPDPDALYGYRLGKLAAHAYTYRPDGSREERAMEHTDWMRVSVVLSGAALAFMKEESLMRFAPSYLCRQVENRTTADVDRPAPSGRPRPFMTARDTSQGGEGKS